MFEIGQVVEVIKSPFFCQGYVGEVGMVQSVMEAKGIVWYHIHFFNGKLGMRFIPQDCLELALLVERIILVGRSTYSWN